MKPAKGLWEHEANVYSDRVIPVRIKAMKQEMMKIANMTIQHYEQLAVMYYRLSNDCIVQYATDSQINAFTRLNLNQPE